MITGELWVEHPLLPWIMTILSWWVLCGTIVMVRNWVRLRRSERHNKLLQEMLVEGVGSVARRITRIEKRINAILKPFTSKKERAGELCSGESGIQTEEQPAPAIEEAGEDGDGVTVVEIEDEERAGSRST